MGQHDVISESRSVEFTNENGVRVVWTPPSDMTDPQFYRTSAIVSATALPETVMINGVNVEGQENEVRDGSSGGNFVGENVQLSTTNLDVWAKFADRDTRLDPDRSRRFVTGLRGLPGSSAAAASGAAAATAASRKSYFDSENRRLDAQQAGQRFDNANDLANQSYRSSAADSALDRDFLDSRRQYDADKAALAIRGADGQADFNQSRLDNSLDKLGLDASDYRRGESVSADPYRALESDQAGVASGQRRYAQDVRAAATRSQESKIALEEQSIAEAKAEEERLREQNQEQIAIGQVNSNRSYNLGLRAVTNTENDNAWQREFSINNAAEVNTATWAGFELDARKLGLPSWTNQATGITHDFSFPVVAADVDEAKGYLLDMDNSGATDEDPTPDVPWSWSGSKGYAATGGGGFI